MNRKAGLAIVSLILLLGMADVLAEIAVGVKKGDWIEYSVEYAGTPTEGHDVIWAKMEIMDVQEESVNVAITVRYSNGTMEKLTSTFNLETGQIGDDFIIPANLNSGDKFLDQNIGYITISGVEERTYAGATRTVVYASTTETTYYWDRATGILVEGHSNFPDYTMNTIVDKTNIWQPQILGLDPAAFYAIVIGVAALIIAVVAFLFARRKK